MAFVAAAAAGCDFELAGDGSLVTTPGEPETVGTEASDAGAAKLDGKMAGANSRPTPLASDAGRSSDARAVNDGGADRLPGTETGRDATPGADTIPPGNGAMAPTGTLVPLYTHPTHSSWTLVIQAKMSYPSVPVVAVFNPSSGPGSARSGSYVDGVARLKAADITVLGYVATTYTRRPEADVKADIDRYRAWYPQTTGIFFDEQTNTRGGEDYYRRIDAYARSKGFTFTVGNPGADSTPSYIGTVDLILVYESSGLPRVDALGGWHADYDRRNFGIIPYGVPAVDSTFVAKAKKQVGYIYITQGTMPNPWANVPSYFTTLMAELAI